VLSSERNGGSGESGRKGDCRSYPQEVLRDKRRSAGGITCKEDVNNRGRLLATPFVPPAFSNLPITVDFSERLAEPSEHEVIMKSGTLHAALIVVHYQGHAI